MAIHLEYKPPKVDAAAVLAAGRPVIVTEAAQMLLDASQPLVPVDQGDLKESGHLEPHGTGVAVVYDATSPEGYPYGINQHEDLSLHHPNGGQAKFVEQPKHTEAPTIAARMFHSLAKLFRL